MYAKLHENRQYEFLLISGLNRFTYFNGILLYITIECLFTTLSFCLTFMVYNVCNTTVGANFVIGTFIMTSSVAYCFSFCFFSYALFDNSAAIIVFSTLLGFLPGNLVALLGSVLQLTGAGFKFLVGVI